MLGAGPLALASGLPIRSARAETEVRWIGWEGYDAHFDEGTFLADNDMSLTKTYISSNEEITRVVELSLLDARAYFLEVGW